MTIIIIGSRGLLGNALVKACTIRGIRYIPYCSPHFSILNTDSYHQLQLYSQDCVINCVAYTAVDAAQENPDLCYELNAYAPARLASYIHDCGAYLITLSTDYIFNGIAHATQKYLPFKPHDTPDPINSYGKSKLLGEQLISQHHNTATIIRTSWVYSGAKNGKDFVARIANAAQEGEAISVVADQIGSPTYVHDLAHGLTDYACALADNTIAKTARILHYSCKGTCSRYELAQKIYSLLECDPDLVTPILSADNKALAVRPHFSALDSSSWAQLGFTAPRHWHDSLTEALRARTFS